jgi:hypothetical protein
VSNAAARNSFVADEEPGASFFFIFINDEDRSSVVAPESNPD